MTFSYSTEVYRVMKVCACLCGTILKNMSFLPPSWILVKKLFSAIYRTKGLFALYNIGVTLLYGKMTSTGSNFVKTYFTIHFRNAFNGTILSAILAIAFKMISCNIPIERYFSALQYRYKIVILKIDI